MSGHSHWSGIKYKKGAADAKRGKLFSKLSKYIITAARDGGGDPDSNLKLRYAIDKAKAASMPKDNIERAIRRGAGLEKTESLERITYEGYGPGGTALMVQVLTDNRNRTVSEIRRAFSRHGGNLGENGCVAWMFEPKGYITIPMNGHDADELFELAVEAGADDVIIGEDMIEVYADVGDFEGVQEALSGAQIEMDTAELSMVAQSKVNLDLAEGLKLMGLVDALEELDDVEQVYTNLDITDEMFEQYAQSS